MIVPFNDLHRIYLGNEEALKNSLVDAIKSGWWINGQRTVEFCSEFASYLNVRHCIGVANGTDALEIALRALISVRGIAGKEVIVPPNAGGYATIACHLNGLTPVYADVLENSQLIDLDSVCSALCKETAAVIVTHLYGGVVNVVLLREMMDDAGYAYVPIVEDCAQAHGASLDGRRVGSLSDVAAFSFYPTKNLGAIGDGGAIVTSDGEIAKRCELLRQYGWTSKYAVGIPGGRNSRLDEIQAAVLLPLLRQLDQSNQRRLSIYERYASVLPDKVKLVESDKGNVAHLATVVCHNRDSLSEHMGNCGVTTAVHYPVLDSEQVGWQQLPKKIAPGGIPVAQSSVLRILTLPCFPGMTDIEIDCVCEALRTWKT